MGRDDLINMPKPIVYLGSKYHGHEKESVEENNHAMADAYKARAERKESWIPYSPILGSDAYERWRLVSHCPFCGSRDHNITNVLDLTFRCNQCHKLYHKSIAQNYPMPEYVAEDLGLLEVLCVDEPYCGAEGQGYDRYSIYHDGCNDCVFVGKHEEFKPSKCLLVEWHQPKIILAVLPSAMITIEFCKLNADSPLDEMIMEAELCTQYSMGVIKEYYFAQAHHILVIPFATVLTKPFDRWSEDGI